MLVPIVLVQSADHDAPAGAGVDKLAFLQVDAYVVGTSSFAAVEEHQVAFAQLAASHALAFFHLFGGAAGQVDAIDLLIDLAHEARTVRALAALSAAAVGRAYPLRGFQVEGVVVLRADVHAQTVGSADEGAIVQRGRGGAAARQAEEKAYK